MAHAVELAALGPVYGPNPRVGCVLLAPEPDEGAWSNHVGAPRGGPAPDDVGDARPRRVIGEGYHRGAGTPHAEIDALHDARRRGIDPRGATAVVTLEPCSHTGRTPPCAEGLAAAGIGHVVYAVTDPNRLAAGGAEVLRTRGIRVTHAPHERASALNDVWATAVRRGAPFVTLKVATTLDGRVAAADGTSRWITGDLARAHAHEVRRRVDAIIVGTGTVAADDPALTARNADGALAGHQPLRVVVGTREVPAGARLRGPGGELVHLATHDVHVVLAELGGREIRHVLIEGGPTLATAFLRADVVDELHAYTAPLVLGAGAPVVGDLGVDTLAAAAQWRTVHVERLGDDVLMIARRHRPRTARDAADADSDADADATARADAGMGTATALTDSVGNGPPTASETVRARKEPA
ncbi:bifunctional diaminohydroxyphosphoribosylaminopyrimidine deaminase/5-amino-6-(5-phosphoribosylamino)uracil reductase RibD [Pseudoclavibacter endophyticus]|uniref:Riboflavin biosynthesis protein RibD n=2 Tax=Pseudoclavibacter endophyticus TaxID=1778590 RepID=A0A6H9WHT0_9MICO|nr:bifunctional diaminohydroxyphosphoribosylaminopyrimidine deaminase/5-amino-6-(5-phosphoribosylamino)uracil reductase RibD [Pseudoclavibacter endophyticus]